MKVGVLTAGGDCPGLNAAIRGVVARVTAGGAEVVGIQKGWRGLMEGLARPLTRDTVRGILHQGGTILGTSRMDPYVHGGGFESVRGTVEKEEIDVLVVIGGDGSLRTAQRLEVEGLPVVGIPKTIDNDIPGTDVTFGFHTAVQIVTDAIDRLTTTAESHNRVMVVEVMGRTAGWIAAYAGMAGGAEAILVPEIEYDLESLAERLRARHRAGHDYSILVVAEGTPSPDGATSTTGVDAFGFARLGGVAYSVAEELEELTNYECRVTTLGYLQRGGTPTAYDRILATRLGLTAGELALTGKTGVMVAVRGEELVPMDLEVVSGAPRALTSERYAETAWFFA